MNHYSVYLERITLYSNCCCLVAKSCLNLATAWTVTHQAPLFMGFAKQEYWSGLPLLSPRDRPDPGIEPVSPALTGGFFVTEPPGKPTLEFKKKLSEVSQTEERCHMTSIICGI